MSDSLPSIVAVLGNDDGLVQEAAVRWYDKLTHGTEEYAHEIIDGNVALVEDAVSIIMKTLEGLQTLGFFGSKKVIWLKGCSFIADNVMSRSQETQNALENLLDYIKEGFPPDVHLLLTAYDVDRRRSFYKTLTKIALLEEYNKPDISKEGWQGDVAKVTKEAAKKRGLEFESDALDLFVNRVSESSKQIFNELNKLDLYLGTERRMINSDDVTQMVPLTRTGVIFEIGRAIEQGDVVRSLQLIDRQLENDEKPISIMRAAIIPVIRNLYTASIIVKEFSLPTHNYNAFQSALSSLSVENQSIIPKKKDGAPNAYPVFLAIQKLHAFPGNFLKTAMRACFEADKNLVTSTLDNTVILHKLVVQLCQRNGKNKSTK